MGQRHESHPPVKLFFAVMTGSDAGFAQAEKRLVEIFGNLDLRSEMYHFDPLTDYYSREFGVGLRKVLWSAEQLIAPEDLVETKCRTNDLEADIPSGAATGRIVNIDPGYLNHAKVVLASTKDHAHRLYVARGIYEEVTLHFDRRSARYEPHPWTYPDYRMSGVVDFLGLMREKYRLQLKAAS